MSLYFRYFVIIDSGKTWIPFNQGLFDPSLVEIVPVVLDKKTNMRKVYDNNDNNNDEQRTRKEWTTIQLIFQACVISILAWDHIIASLDIIYQTILKHPNKILVYFVELRFSNKSLNSPFIIFRNFENIYR